MGIENYQGLICFNRRPTVFISHVDVTSQKKHCSIIRNNVGRPDSIASPGQNHVGPKTKAGSKEPPEKKDQASRKG